MICQKCKAEGKTSRVYPQAGSHTITSPNSVFWDEQGTCHCHSEDKFQESFRCSNGHSWIIRRRNVCHCGWKQEIWDWILPEGSTGYIYGDHTGTYTTVNGKPVLVEQRKLTDADLTRYL